MSDPSKLEGLLGQVVGGMGIAQPLQVGRLFRAWADIVGAELAAKCRPVSLRDGVLRVETSSPAWANELRYLAPAIIDAVNRELGTQVAKQVKATVSRQSEEPSSTPSREPKTNDRLPKPEVISKSDRAEAEKVTSSIGDPGLAEATKRALLAAKMRKKRGG